MNIERYIEGDPGARARILAVLFLMALLTAAIVLRMGDKTAVRSLPFNNAANDPLVVSTQFTLPPSHIESRSTFINVDQFGNQREGFSPEHVRPGSSQDLIDFRAKPPVIDLK